MSIKIMSAVFENETLGPTERLIMLALADHADDAGRCYPSMSRLCQRTGLGERAIQNNLKALVAKGYVTIVPNAGPSGTNVFFVRAVSEPRSEIAVGGSARMPDAHGRFAIYRRDNHTCAYCGYLSPDGEQNLTLDHIVPQSQGGGHEPENLVTACMDCNRKKKGRTPFEWLGDDCPPHLMRPARNAPRTKCASTPASRSKTPAPDAPKPSRTIIEPSDGDTERDRVKVRMTADWHPGETGIAYALKQNIPQEIIEDEIAGFRVYWMDRTDKLGRKSCEGWLQCWQNRCRDLATRYAGRRPASGGSFGGRGQQPDGIVGAVLRSRAARAY